jgi:hypothetical protein
MGFLEAGLPPLMDASVWDRLGFSRPESLLRDLDIVSLGIGFKSVGSSGTLNVLWFRLSLSTGAAISSRRAKGVGTPIRLSFEGAFPLVIKDESLATLGWTFWNSFFCTGLSEGLSEDLSDDLSDGLSDSLSEDPPDGRSEGLSKCLSDGCSEYLSGCLSDDLPDGFSADLCDGLSAGFWDGLSACLSGTLSTGLSEDFPAASLSLSREALSNRSGKGSLAGGVGIGLESAWEPAGMVNVGYESGL